MKISKNDLNRLYELKKTGAWCNAWTWVGNDTQRFINRLVKVGVMEQESEPIEGYSIRYYVTQEFIDFIGRKEFFSSTTVK